MPIAVSRQLVLGDLEQLVARIGFEDVQQRLAVMARSVDSPARATCATLWRSSGIARGLAA